MFPVVIAFLGSLVMFGVGVIEPIGDLKNKMIEVVLVILAIPFFKQMKANAECFDRSVRRRLRESEAWRTTRCLNEVVRAALRYDEGDQDGGERGMEQQKAGSGFGETL